MILRRLQAVERLAGVERPPAGGDLGDGGLRSKPPVSVERLSKRTLFLHRLSAD